MVLWLDTETYSTCDIHACGAYTYSLHESTRILLVTYAIDDGEVITTSAEDGRFRAAFEKADSIVAHNAQFDRWILAHKAGLVAPISKWIDTMGISLSHGLPASLGVLCAALGMPEDEGKIKDGRRLIGIFCKPPIKGSKIKHKDKTTHPEDWAKFVEYARRDVSAMRKVWGLMPHWNDAIESDVWCCDQTINERGFGVDVPLALNAMAMIEQEQARLTDEVSRQTKGAVGAVTQRDAMLEYILREHGVALPDMRADTIRRRAEDPELPEAVRDLLRLRLDGAKTSGAKFAAIINASSGGRIRGGLQYCGASRTGRWAGRLFQPQNLPRQTLAEDGLNEAIEAIGSGLGFEILDNPMDAASNILRSCIIPAKGKTLVAADLANIEGRVLAWLAGEDWKIEAFKLNDEGKARDTYVMAFARAFGINPDTVDPAQRQVGKVMELALGYYGGVGAFLTFASTYNLDLATLVEPTKAALPALFRDGVIAARKGRNTFDLDPDVFASCHALTQAWRAAHPATVALWRDLENAVRGAIGTPGFAIRVGKLAARRDGSWLRIKLPSGRYLCYPGIKINSDGKIAYLGIDQYTRKWQDILTHGGKLTENVTQAVARDILAHGMLEAERSGRFEVVLSVHDELIAETKDGTPEELSACMTTNPTWARGLPLSAKGFAAQRYRKD